MTVIEKLVEPATTQSPPLPLRMSYEEFLAWADEDTHAEWVEGEVIVQMPPKDRHQYVARYLSTLLDLFVSIFRLGQIRFAPLEVRLGPDGPSREPDLLFVATAHLHRLTPDRLEGAADLVVEIVSDDSVTRDRVDKFDEYEAAGVREYWIIDPRPRRQRALFYQLDEHGLYRTVAPDAEGRVHSAVLPGFWLRPDWLWAEEPPAPLRALAQIVGIEKLMEAVRSA
ncbi:MAG: Uma2 family endonuclease [Chloroflexi bacterium]|nr:Uma2 family endonuclease [Chloroflexota bacterium]